MFEAVGTMWQKPKAGLKNMTQHPSVPEHVIHAALRRGCMHHQEFSILGRHYDRGSSKLAHHLSTYLIYISCNRTQKSPLPQDTLIKCIKLCSLNCVWSSMQTSARPAGSVRAACAQSCRITTFISSHTRCSRQACGGRTSKSSELALRTAPVKHYKVRRCDFGCAMGDVVSLLHKG